jgi:hypothetical protein
MPDDFSGLTLDQLAELASNRRRQANADPSNVELQAYAEAAQAALNAASTGGATAGYEDPQAA